jgi:hypothetical protein
MVDIGEASCQRKPLIITNVDRCAIVTYCVRKLGAHVICQAL